MTKRLKTNKITKRGPQDIAALDEYLRCLRKCSAQGIAPQGGWIRAIREALGMTNVQLAERLDMAPQSIEDLQKSEVAGSIKLQSLRNLAGGLGCELVYALVPLKSLGEMRNDQINMVAGQVMKHINRRGSRKGKASVASTRAVERDLQKLIREMLTSNPKMLWK